MTDSSPASASNLTLSSNERLHVIQFLNKLSGPQLEELIFALNPPSGILPRIMTAQGYRTTKLMHWVEGPTGPGLIKVHHRLKTMTGVSILDLPDDTGTQEINLFEEREIRSRIVQASFLPNLYRLRSATAEFLEEHSGQPSVFGVEREPESFDSDFFKLVPEFTDMLAVAPDSGEIQGDVTTLSVLLFKANELLSENSKLQRDGYHAAWINHKDLFIGSAREINFLSVKIIRKIENMHIT